MLQVHHGFYSAYYNTTVRHEILKSVQWAWKTYGKLPINVVGHSMGGALASFCALDLSVSPYVQSASSLVDVYPQLWVLNIGCYGSTCRIGVKFNFSNPTIK